MHAYEMHAHEMHAHKMHRRVSRACRACISEACILWGGSLADLSRGHAPHRHVSRRREYNCCWVRKNFDFIYSHFGGVLISTAYGRPTVGFRHTLLCNISAFSRPKSL